MKKFLKKSLSLMLCLLMLLSFATVGFAEDESESKVTRLSVCVNGDTASSRGFCWYTQKETETKICVYKNGQDVTDSLTVSDVSCSEWKGSYMHKLTLSGLEGGTLYTYKVGNGETWSETGSFVTDNGDSNVNFIAIADVQASSKENFEKGAATLSAALEMMPNADFVANLGDFTNDSTNEEWNLYDEVFSSVNKDMTLVPVAGNHDGLGVWNWFNNMFCLDTSESVQTLNGVNYSYDYGNAHFAVLNTNDMLSVSVTQLEWLQNDLNSTDKDWKIVLMHKSPYTLGKDGKWPDALYLQKSLTKVLDDCGADIVFSGHDHMYLRTKTLKNNALDENGTTYVLSGTAGSKRYEIRSFCADTYLKTEFIDALTVQKEGYANYWNGSDWNNTKDTNVGGCFNLISIDGGTLTLNSYILSDEKSENGEDVITNIDTLTLTKETGKNEITFTGDNTTSSGEYIKTIGKSCTELGKYTIFEWLPKFISMLPKLLKVYFTEGTF